MSTDYLLHFKDVSRSILGLSVYLAMYDLSWWCGEDEYILLLCSILPSGCALKVNAFYMFVNVKIALKLNGIGILENIIVYHVSSWFDEMWYVASIFMLTDLLKLSISLPDCYVYLLFKKNNLLKVRLIHVAVYLHKQYHFFL